MKRGKARSCADVVSASLDAMHAELGEGEADQGSAGLGRVGAAPVFPSKLAPGCGLRRVVLRDPHAGGAEQSEAGLFDGELKAPTRMLRRRAQEFCQRGCWMEVNKTQRCTRIQFALLSCCRSSQASRVAEDPR